jgi:hypothetical protein
VADGVTRHGGNGHHERPHHLPRSLPLSGIDSIVADLYVEPTSSANDSGAAVLHALKGSVLARAQGSAGLQKQAP